MKAILGVAGVFAAATILLASTEASAAGHANGLGEKGQLIITADRLVPLFNYASSSVTQTVGRDVERTDTQSGSGLSLLFTRDQALTDGPMNVHTLPRVAFDVTVIPRLTLGAAIAFGFGLGGTNEEETVGPGTTKTTRKSDAPTGTAIGLAPRVGYILPLSDIFAFWPRAGLGFYSVSVSRETRDNNVVTTTRTTDTQFSLDLDPQFAIVPLEHFFIHAGPIVSIPFGGSRSISSTTGSTTNERSHDASVFNLGLSAGLGGWFNVF